MFPLVQDLGEELAMATTRYRKEMLERKKLHNIIQELKGNIRVYMRCRPPTRKEIEQFGTHNSDSSSTFPLFLCVPVPNTPFLSP
jgi:hypothetical protein